MRNPSRTAPPSIAQSQTEAFTQLRAAMESPRTSVEPLDHAQLVAAVAQSVSAAMTAALTPMLEVMLAQANRAPDPAPEVYVNAPAAESPREEIHIHNEITVEPTPVTVTNDVQPAPVVNNVSPGQLEVTVNAKLPARRTESDVKRDGEGQIVHVTQTETNLE